MLAAWLIKTRDVFIFLVHSIFLSFLFDLDLQHCIELICCVLYLPATWNDVLERPISSEFGLIHCCEEHSFV